MKTPQVVIKISRTFQSTRQLHFIQMIPFLSFISPASDRRLQPWVQGTFVNVL